jgi:ComEC/Rec2-related protein
MLVYLSGPNVTTQLFECNADNRFRIVDRTPVTTFSDSEDRHAIGLARKYIVNAFEYEKLSPASRGFLSAMILADRSNLSREVRDEWRHLGIAHYLALSGLHLGMIAIPLFRILSLLRIRGFARDTVGIAILSFYTTVAHCPHSLIRALMLLVTLRIYRVMSRRISLFEALLVTSFILIVIHPAIITSVGFILSVLAVAGIALIGVPLVRLLDSRLPVFRAGFIIRYLAGSFIVSFSVQIFILPLTSRVFGFAPAAGPLMTVIMALPVAGTLMSGFAYLLSFPILADCLCVPVNLASFLMTEIPRSVPALPGLGILGVDYDLKVYMIALIMVSAGLWGKGFKKSRALTGILLLIISFYPSIRGISIPDKEKLPWREGFFLGGKNGCGSVLIKGDLHRIDSPKTARFIWGKGLRGLDYLVLTGSGCGNIGIIESLSRNIRLKNIICSPYLLDCDDASILTRSGKLCLRTVVGIEEYSIGIYKVVIRGPSDLTTGKVVPRSGADLDISSLDLKSHDR